MLWGGHRDLDYGTNSLHNPKAKDKAQQQSNKPQNNTKILS